MDKNWEEKQYQYDLKFGSDETQPVVDINDLREMPLEEIEKYGANIQKFISKKSDEFIKKASETDNGGVKNSLNQLQMIVDKRTKSIPTALAPFSKIRNFIEGHQKIESRIDGLANEIQMHQERLGKHIAFMEEQSEAISEALEALDEYEVRLQAYSDELKAETPENQRRIQAVADRLKIITATRVTTEQAQISSMMIVAANRESRHQLEEVTANVLPILRMQTVNAIGIQANRDSMEIAERTRLLTSQLIEKNAKDVKEMTAQLQNNRTRSIIDEDKLMQAQKILQEALESVADMSKQEAELNLKVADDLNSAAKNNSLFIKRLKLQS